MILTLALFLRPAEQKRCCLATQENRKFRPGFFLQGILNRVPISFPFYIHAFHLVKPLSHTKLLISPNPKKNTLRDLCFNHLIQQPSYFYTKMSSCKDTNTTCTLVYNKSGLILKSSKSTGSLTQQSKCSQSKIYLLWLSNPSKFSLSLFFPAKSRGC